jgi:hypothetical protein
LAEGLDLVVGAWVLSAELVAGEADDFKVVGVGCFEVFVEFLESRELGREAAFRGRVDDQDDFVGEVRERVGRAFLWGVGLVVHVEEEHRMEERKTYYRQA